MFVDEAVILCKAGDGGKGCSSMDRSHPRRHRANGGDGGDGGSIILEANPNIHTLLDFELNREFKAPGGTHGSSNHKRGYRGDDLLLAVPVGTEIIDSRAGELLKDLDRSGLRVVVCHGGKGGHGNDKKNDAMPGEPGEFKEIFLKLKLIADIGLIGYPNAGKSALLSRVSNAKSKAAAYPFTTKNPILGVVKFDVGETKVLADIPGIIEGAHEGKGLGIKFLKHVERTKALLHVIDFGAVDGRDPVSDYRTLNQELEDYSKALSEKEQILAANKMDLPEARKNLELFRRKVKKEIFPISAATGEGLDVLLQRLRIVN